MPMTMTMTIHASYHMTMTVPNLDHACLLLYDDTPETPAKAGLRDGGRLVLCILAPFAAAAAARVGG